MVSGWVGEWIKMGLRQFGMLGSNHAKNGKRMSPICAHMYDEYEMDPEGYYYGQMYDNEYETCGLRLRQRSRYGCMKNKKMESWVGGKRERCLLQTQTESHSIG